MIKVETDEEAEYNIKWWKTLAKSLRITINYKLNNRNILSIIRIYSSGFCFFTIQFYDKKYFDGILQVISELSFEPKVTLIYERMGFYYINFRFKI